MGVVESILLAFLKGIFAFPLSYTLVDELHFKYPTYPYRLIQMYTNYSLLAEIPQKNKKIVSFEVKNLVL